jgi:hypothetical protein
MEEESDEEKNDDEEQSSFISGDQIENTASESYTISEDHQIDQQYGNADASHIGSVSAKANISPFTRQMEEVIFRNYVGPTFNR